MNLALFKTLFPRASNDTIKANTDKSYEKGDVVFDHRTKEYMLCKGETTEMTHDDNADIKLQSSQLERDKAAALGATTKREKESLGRVKVRFIGYRCRPLDPDNFAGGCKDLLDGLRHAGLIPDDRPQDIIFETVQEKVAHRGDERTQIVLEYL